MFMPPLSRADRPVDPPRQDILDLHHLLVRDYRALHEEDQVFIVADLDIGISVATVPIADISPPAWPGLVRETHAHYEGRGFTVRAVWVFAYAAAARECAENVRRYLQAVGWAVVHGDVTGCRIARTPFSIGHRGQPATENETGAVPGVGDRPMPASTSGAWPAAAWWSAPGREQRFGDLITAGALLAGEPGTSISAPVFAAVQDALSDVHVRLGCLTWINQASIGLWQYLAQTAPSPTRTIAGAILACTLYQRGRRSEAFTAFEHAHADIVRQSAERSPAPKAHPASGAPELGRVPADTVMFVQAVGHFIVHDFNQGDILAAIDKAESEQVLLHGR